MSDIASAYRTVDAQPEAAELIEAMRQTAAWPAVQWLRSWTRPWLEVASGQPILDVGCGLADVLIGLGRDRPDDLRAVGVDASQRMLKQARADAQAAGVAVELHRADAAALPFPDGCFAAVRCERTLQWVGDPAAAVAEMVRVLRPGGALVLIDTDWRTAALDLDDPELEDLLTRTMTARPGADVGGRLRRMARDAGLEGVRVTGATAVVTDWDPDERDAPPGFIPPHLLARVLHEVGGLARSDAEARAAQLVTAARRGAFQMTVSLLAVVATRAASRGD